MIVLRIWDYIYSENLFALIKVSIALLKLIEKDLLKLDTLGFDMLLRHIKGDKKKNVQDEEYTITVKDIDPEALIKISKKVGLTNEKISKYTIDYIKKVTADQTSLYYKFYSDYHTNVRSPTYLAAFQKEIDQFLIKYELMGLKEEVEVVSGGNKDKYIADEEKPLVVNL